MLDIDETINSVMPRAGQAVVPHDAKAMFKLARGQGYCGSQMLDVKAGAPPRWDGWCSAFLQAYHVGKLGAI